MTDASAGFGRPWHERYDPGVPGRLDYPDQALDVFLRRAAAERPSRSALIFFGRRLDYAELDAAVDRLAAGLARQGVRKGDRVGLFMPNCPQFVMSYYAVLRLGAVAVLLNPLYVAREVCHRLLDSGARTVIVLSRFHDRLRAVCSPDGADVRIVVAEIKTYFPTLLRTLYTLFRERREGDRIRIGNDPRAVWFTELLRSDDRPPKVDVGPDDPAVLVYTGGTTGVPKATELTHGNLTANALQTTAWNIDAVYGEDVMLTAIPLSHAYAATVCMNQAVANAWTQVLIPDPRRIDDVLDAIVKHRPTYFPAVPALYNAINNHPRVTSGRVRITSIKSCISGAAGLPGEVRETFERLTGARLVEGYGLSEASPVACCNPLGSGGKPGSIGLPYPDTDVRIVDYETEREAVPPGEPGILCLRGPQVMRGYWNMPKETEEVMKPDTDGRVWLHTGDVVVQDADGYLTIVDRKKEVIITPGGFKIFPRQVEEILYEHEAVYEAAVIAMPDGEQPGERAKAVVVLKPGRSATAEEILEHCRRNLAPYLVPRVVVFRKELPKSPVGKILKRQLAEESDD